jgi:hypothetical protein
MSDTGRLGDFLNDGEGAILRPHVYDDMRNEWMPTSTGIKRRIGASTWAEVAAHYGLRMPAPRPGRSVLLCNRWLVQQHIDLGVPLRALRDEYFSRHAEETGYEAADRDSSLYGVIRRERKRRAKRAAMANTDRRGDYGPAGDEVARSGT